jgi:2-(1,2-epoxy-1,2-dihydrophenyl)acetyl-CoA isomerase
MNGTRDVKYELSSTGVATITLSRPDSLNALTTEMATVTLPLLCAQVAEDSDVKVVVITGDGRGFCSGADIGERIPTVVNAADTATLERPIGAFVKPIWDIPKPVIASVNGVAGGGGMSVACAADFRIVADTATFVPAFVRRGLMPDGGLTYLLPKLVSRSYALRVLMTGEGITAVEALERGLADRVVPAEQLVSATTEFADKLAAGPAVALSFTKRAVQRADGLSFASQLEFESWGQMVCFKTDDFAEGIQAFKDHRKPDFKGR